MTKWAMLSVPRFPVEPLSLVSLLTVSLAAAWVVAALGTSQAPVSGAPVAPEKTARVQLPFVENHGQLATDVSHYVRTSAAIVYVTRAGELVYGLSGQEGAAGWVLKESFAGAGPLTPRGYGDVRGPGKFIAGVEHAAGATLRQGVSLGEPYPRIELGLRAYGNNVDKVFVLRPGADPAAIRVDVSGARAFRITRRGELEIDTAIGVLRFDRPVAYQMRDGRKEYVAVRYAVGENGYGFVVGLYDPRRTLIIE